MRQVYAEYLSEECRNPVERDGAVIETAGGMERVEQLYQVGFIRRPF